MARLLILLTLPPDVTEQYRTRLAKIFPEIAIDVATTADKAAPALASADMLLMIAAPVQQLVEASAAQHN